MHLKFSVKEDSVNLFNEVNMLNVVQMLLYMKIVRTDNMLMVISLFLARRRTS